MRILGIDPGSRLTGYGMVCISGRRTFSHLTHGVVTLPADLEFELRLKKIFITLCALIEEFKPDAVAIEKVFFAKNAVSALKLGQARGVALLTAGMYSLPVAEYNATEIKKLITGQGHAEKAQVSKMIQLLLKINAPEKFDATDALAIALSHALVSSSRMNVALHSPLKNV